MTEVTDATFQNVLHSSGIIVVKFWAEWCAPCRLMTPIVEAAAMQYPDMTFYSAELEKNSAMAKELKVTKLPTILVFKDGQESQRIEGLRKELIL